MKILAIDTSCDETAAAVTNKSQVVSNVIWSQAKIHSLYGGVVPNIAQRQHHLKINQVIKRAIKTSGVKMSELDAVAVTTGPGLAVSLGVGITKARKIADTYKLPLIPINHIESHLLSSLAIKNSVKNDSEISTPSVGIVLSGGTTLIALVEDLGKYKILAETHDDALGEALDKAARLLGLGYPGAHLLEKMARIGDSKIYSLPIPLVEDKVKNRFSYSGLKTAFFRLVESKKPLTKKVIIDLAATFQKAAFKHFINVFEYQIKDLKEKGVIIKDVYFGGGVANNVEIRKLIRKVCKINSIKLHVPFSKKLNGDNAAMIGVCAYLKNRNLSKNELVEKYLDNNIVDRNPKQQI